MNGTSKVPAQFEKEFMKFMKLLAAKQKSMPKIEVVPHAPTVRQNPHQPIRSHLWLVGMKLGPGLTFSWKRAIGLTCLKQKISRKTGIPLTRSGWQRKIGKMLGMK